VTPKPWNPLEESGPQPPKVAFDDVTAESGFEFKHVNGASENKYLPETMGSGVVVFDYDGDGKLDLFCVQGQEWPGKEKLKPAPTCKLFRNVGGFKFEDVSAGSGLDVTLLGMGGTAADYDGDGDPDLFVTALGPCRLFRNDHDEGRRRQGRDPLRRRDREVGHQRRRPGPTPRGSSPPCWSTSAAWLDYDCDGVPRPVRLPVRALVGRERRRRDDATAVTKAYTEADALRRPTPAASWQRQGRRHLRGRDPGDGRRAQDAKALGCASPT
jgi:hypothetical protein